MEYGHAMGLPFCNSCFSPKKAIPIPTNGLVDHQRATYLGLARDEHRMTLGLTLWTWPYLQDDAAATCDTP
jgi:hypothetical protein